MQTMVTIIYISQKMHIVFEITLSSSFHERTDIRDFFLKIYTSYVLAKCLKGT